jgi:hypothetical protein
MAAKHTPGPWNKRALRSLLRFGEKNDGPWNDGGDDGLWMPGEDDADLIAAAPELLEALEDLLGGWGYIRQVHGDLYGVGSDQVEAKAESAIKKARGEE